MTRIWSLGLRGTAAVLILVASCGSNSATTASDGSVQQRDEAPAGESWGPLAVVEGDGSEGEALIAGQLQVTDDCVLLDERGELALLVWPEGRTKWHAGTRAVQYKKADGAVETLHHDDEVWFSGAGSSRLEDGMSAEDFVASVVWAAEPSSECMVDTRWFVGDLLNTAGPVETSSAGSYVPPDGWSVERQLAVDTAMLNSDGVTIDVPIIGGSPGQPADPCARNYELVATESDIDVRVALFKLAPTAPDEKPENYTCTDEGHSWRLTATLERPLGDREFIDESHGASAPLVDLALVLQPTYVPAGFDSHPPTVDHGELRRHLSSLTDTAFISITSNPVGQGNSLDAIRARDLVEIEEIALRSTSGIRATSLEDGAVTLAWEENDRLYQVHGYLVDPIELSAIADSMG